MKRTIAKFTAGLFFVASIGFMPTSAYAVPPMECGSEVIDCPGLGTGSRTICHEHGGGVGCECGESTTCD